MILQTGRNLAFFLVLGLFTFSCSKTPPPTPASNSTACTLAIYAAPKTLSTQEKDSPLHALEGLKKAIERETSLSVLLLPMTRQKSHQQVELLAAQHQTPWALNIFHPTGRPNGFVSGTLIQVQEGKIFRDLALPRNQETSIRKKLVSWIKETLPDTSPCSSFDVIKFSERLVREKRCPELLDLLRDYNYRSSDESIPGNRIFHQCQQARLLQESAGGIGNRNLIRMRLENVPEYLYPRFEEVAQRPYLNKSVGEVTQQFSDLTIGCNEGCMVGEVRLTVQFHLDWYQAHLQDPKKPFEPYEPLAKTLLQYRREASRSAGLNSILGFALSIHLLDVTGEELVLNVRGSEQKPKLSCEIDPKPFLFPEL